MAGATPDRMSAATAQLIEDRELQILAQFEDLLRTSRSTLVQEPAALRQAIRHAACILADVIASLRRGEVVFDASSIGLAEDIGESRASGRIQVTESMNAAVLLFEAVFTEVAGLLGSDPASRATLSLAARALHRSLAERVRIAYMAYNSYVLNRVHEALLEERRRIARELHDRVGSGISAASRNLELFEMYEHDEPAIATVRVAGAQEALRETMDEVRLITTSLRLQVPQGGLEKALLQYVESAAHQDIDSVVVVNGDERWVAYSVSSELFLIAREALRNALAHGNPDRLAARIDITPDEVRAVIEDDGSGFDVEMAGPGGAGIESMRERARLLGGSVTVTSWPGLGTRVEIFVPAGKGEI